MSFIPENTPQLSVYLMVEDINASIEFYKNAFGFTLQNRNEVQPGNVHVEMRKGDALIMFANVGAFGSTKKTPKQLGIDVPVNSYVYTEDTDALYKKSVELGAGTVMEPHDSFWGDRFCSITDHDGYEWGFGTKI